MLELRLRHWFKDVLGGDCEWIEPTRGSSVGVGDAIIHLPRNGRLPVELKIWRNTTKGLCCDMRPAQIRYHYMTWYKNKGKTAIVFGFEGEKDIYVLAGQYVPKDKYKHSVAEKMVHVGSMNVDIDKPQLFRSIMRAFNK